MGSGISSGRGEGGGGGGYKALEVKFCFNFPAGFAIESSNCLTTFFINFNFVSVMAPYLMSLNSLKQLFKLGQKTRC